MKVEDGQAARAPRVASIRQRYPGCRVIGVFAAPAARGENSAGDTVPGDILKSWLRDQVNAFQVMGSYASPRTGRQRTWVRFYFADADGQQIGEDTFIRVFGPESYALFAAAREISSTVRAAHDPGSLPSVASELQVHAGDVVRDPRIAFAEGRREPTRADWRQWLELGAS